MKFLVDTQLPPKLASYLAEKGHHAVHTRHYENGHLLDDKSIIDLAKEENQTIISKDSDFVDHFMLKGQPPKIVNIEFGNISNHDLLDLFDRHFTLVVEAFEGGCGLVVFKRDKVVCY